MALIQVSELLEFTQYHPRMKLHVGLAWGLQKRSHLERKGPKCNKRVNTCQTIIYQPKCEGPKGSVRKYKRNS